MPTRACRGIEYPTTRILLILAGEMATPGAARDYQRNYLGRFDGVSRLSPLFPLPSPSSNRTSGKVGAVQTANPNCSVPGCSGISDPGIDKGALWDKFYTAAPRPRTRSEQQYSDRRLRSRR